MNYSCLQALAQLVGEWLGFGKPPSRELDCRLAKKISSFVLCLKRSWGSIFLTGNRLLCTDGVLSQRFGDFLDLCEKVFLVKFFSLISLLMYMWSLSWFFPFFFVSDNILSHVEYYYSLVAWCVPLSCLVVVAYEQAWTRTCLPVAGAADTATRQCWQCLNKPTGRSN